ncbi:hypothetical protein E2320_008021 [Naja naja]|nr:hypothetical protein E2320_008021 [Naja naja]
MFGFGKEQQERFPQHLQARRVWRRSLRAEAPPIHQLAPPKAKPRGKPRPIQAGYCARWPRLFAPPPPFSICIRNARRSWETSRAAGSVSVGAREAAALWGKPRVVGG